MNEVVTVPLDWHPREYQRPLWDALKSGTKRAVAVWHRRAGKDSVGLNWTIRQAFIRPGLYWHLLPTYAQGRKVVWDGITKDGRKFIDHWPHQLITKIRNDDMRIHVRVPKGESIWQVVGSDSPDRLVGANPIGVVMSEYALQDPAAWNYIRPILVENGGWALFIYTPRGHNHGLTLYEMALGNDDWFCQKLTADDTNVLTEAQIEGERQAGMPKELIEQEFYCSFDAPLVGSYFGDQMSDALKAKRITNVPHDPAVGVETWWDLGIGDATAVWFAQRVGQEVHLIDYHEEHSKPLAHYVGVLQAKALDKGYNYSAHVLPHDAEARELISGKTRTQVLKELNVTPLHVMKRAKVDDGIEAARNMLPRCWFDLKRCDRGIAALREYQKSPMPGKHWRNEQEPEFLDHPLHDWASHGADAFRAGAMFRGARKSREKRQMYPDLGINVPRERHTRLRRHG